MVEFGFSIFVTVSAISFAARSQAVEGTGGRSENHHLTPSNWQRSHMPREVLRDSYICSSQW